MIDALKFAQGAIKKNTATPELEHYMIKDGRVTGFNGYMALSAPLPLDIEALPNAKMFFKALQACGEQVAIAKTENNRLAIRSGSFRAFVPCLEKAVYEAVPEGDIYPCQPGLSAVFERLLPFISDDATRPWAMGLSIGNGAYTATNNVILIQVWTGHSLPQVNCPRFAVAEVARLKKDPVAMQLGRGSLSFLYEDGSWIRTQLLEQEWPLDRLQQILEVPSNQQPVNPAVFEAADALAPFVEGPTSPIYFDADGVGTVQGNIEEGVHIDIPDAGLPEAAFRLKAVQLIAPEAKTIDWTLHPKPCIFYGPDCRGAIMGMNF